MDTLYLGIEGFQACTLDLDGRTSRPAGTRALFREYLRRRRTRLATSRDNWSVAVRAVRAELERLTAHRLAFDQVPIGLFVAGDRCGTCGADLDITAPDRATCPRCGPDAIPW